MRPAGIIFDLDGTLIDNNFYHIESFKEFYKRMNMEFSYEDYTANINGKINKVIFPYILKRELSEEEITKYDDQKESLYRELYAPHIKPIDGLLDFLETLKKENYPLAIATSGLPPNINFMFDNIAIRHYFIDVVNASNITQGKPHPEIFLKAAKSINADPEKCVAFEDSVAGIRSAKAAGMKVIGITTTHTAEEIQEAHKVIQDYTQITTRDLEELMH